MGLWYMNLPVRQFPGFILPTLLCGFLSKAETSNTIRPETAQQPDVVTAEIFPTILIWCIPVPLVAKFLSINAFKNFSTHVWSPLQEYIPVLFMGELIMKTGFDF